MNQHRKASAPGKLVLSGEYAVLDGAPAICMAVDRRARVTVSNISGGQSIVEAPGFAADVGRFELLPDGIRWQTGQEQFALLDVVWRAIDYRSAAAIKLDTADFVDAVSGDKIGIGSSAALTVALCAAAKNSVEIATLAQRLHSQWQGGVGSGVDIACSVNGGLIRYQMAGASVTPLSWPKNLRFRVIWTGVSASTTDKLAKLNERISRPSRVRLAAAAESLASRWCDGDTAGIAAGTRDYVGHLREFDADYNLDVFGAGHGVLCDAADAAQLSYKPCGAGGGDVGIVLGTDDTILDAFTQKLPSNFSVIECALDKVGLRIEDQE